MFDNVSKVINEFNLLDVALVTIVHESERKLVPFRLASIHQDVHDLCKFVECEQFVCVCSGVHFINTVGQEGIVILTEQSHLRSELNFWHQEDTFDFSTIFIECFL